MSAFHTATPGNAAVTAFMRWPTLTTLMAASMTFAGYMPEETETVLLQACSNMSNQLCEQLLPNARRGEAE